MPEEAPIPPVLFGKYRLLKKLAQGGMAEIFLAKATGAGGFEKTVIVKRILPRLAAHDKFVRMFINEAKVTSVLSHSNIVQIFDFGRVGRDYFIAMEYVEGKDLRSIIRACRDSGRRVPMEFILYCGVQIAKALHYAHTRVDPEGNPLNLIHRDVSPQNVLVSRQGEVKLTDFGIAKSTDSLTETLANEIKGNFGYMPPEQAAGQALDPRTDIYAACMVLYEMCTLKNPFADANLLAVIQRIREMAAPPPSSYNAAVSREVDRILLKGLEKDPRARYATAGELAALLSDELFPTATELVQVSFGAFLNSLFPPVPVKTGDTPIRGYPAARGPAPASPPKPDFAFSKKPAEETPLVIGRQEGLSGTGPTAKSPAQRGDERGAQDDARFARKIRDSANLGRLRLDVAPSNVEIYIDSQQVVIGAPIEIQTSAKVEHRLELKAAGFSDFSTTFVLSPGEVRDFQIVLAERMR